MTATFSTSQARLSDFSVNGLLNSLHLFEVAEDGDIDLYTEVCMVKGVGIDIVDVAELRTSIENVEGYLQEIFTEEEIAMAGKRPNPYECFAARLAAKEAMMKALGTGWSPAFEFQDVSVVSDGESTPWLRLSPRAAQLLADFGGKTAFVSLSHTATHATAVVVIDG